MVSDWFLESEADARRTHQIEHNFTQQHVLQRQQRVGIILLGQVLERLVEIGVRGDVVFVFGVEHTRLEVELGLQVGGAVDRVGGGAGGGEGGLV